MTKLEYIEFYKEQIEWYKKQVEFITSHIKWLGVQIKREKYDFGYTSVGRKYIKERQKCIAIEKNIS